MTVFGWDASDYDWSRGPMNMVAAHADGIDFFTHKSTETAPGQIFYHRHYGEALNRARAAGIPFYGTYVVPRSGTPVERQVQNAVSYWDQQTPWWRTDPRFFIQVDLEKWPYDSVSDVIGENMTRLFEPLAPTVVLLYASKGQYGNSIDADMLMWNANYAAENAPTRKYRDIYRAVGGDNGPGWGAYSGRPPIIWQFASDSTIGTQPKCDANAFRGDLAAFAARINAPMPGAPAEGGESVPIKVQPGVVLGPIGQKLAEILSFYPKPGEIYITDGLRNEPGSYHSGKLTYGGSLSAAIDIGFGGTGQPARGRDLAKWLYDNFWNMTVELIHTTPFADDQGFYVKNQVRYPGGGPYAGQTAVEHKDHVHFATSVYLADRILARLKAAATPPAPSPAPEVIVGRPWPSYMPSGHYFGLITGPAESHGGYYENEKADVMAIQIRLRQLGYTSTPADGKFQQATADAVSAWQHAKLPGTTLFGQVWADDWAELFKATPAPVPVPAPTPEPKRLTEEQIIAAVKKAFAEAP